MIELRYASRHVNAPIEQKTEGRQDPDEFSKQSWRSGEDP
jgi:hypothetical protein